MTTAILLAAGTSSRMGAENKLLLSMNGMPLIKQMYDQLMESKADRLVVVLGYENAKVKAAIQDESACFVINREFETGMTSSIKTGINAIDWPCDAVMICLSDQPLLSTSDYNQLLKSTEDYEPPFIQVPTYQSQKGNPLIFSQRFFPDLLNHQELNGCKGVVSTNSQYVRLLEFGNQAVVADMDTPEAFIALKSLINRPS